jgi:hypothetical protein
VTWEKLVAAVVVAVLGWIATRARQRRQERDADRVPALERARDAEAFKARDIARDRAADDVGLPWQRTRPEWSPSIPTLQMAPRSGTCLTESGLVDCVVVKSSDFRAVVRELKACCIATGNSAKDCQAE